MGGAASLPSWHWLPSPHRRTTRRSPVVGVVQHYTGGGNGRSLARWLAGPDAKVSANIITCRDGHIIQQVAFTDEAWHAGEKQGIGLWKGLPQPENVNRFTIGIENSNYGWVIRDDQGKFWIKKKTSTGYAMWKPYKGPHPIGAKDHEGQNRYWEPYTDAIIAANIEVLKRIVDLYPNITPDDVVGHSSISPHRKFDPGPLWPTDYVLDEVFGRQTSGIHSQASGVLIGGEGDPDEDAQEEMLHALRDYYDEDLGMCVDPTLKGGK